VKVGVGELKYEWARFQISCWTHFLIRIPVRRDLVTKREREKKDAPCNELKKSACVNFFFFLKAGLSGVSVFGCHPPAKSNIEIPDI
jgi:hypothetical protein